jgi:hypothetical protein
MARVVAFFKSTAGRVLLLLIANATIVSGFGRFAAAYVRDDGPGMLDLELSFNAGVFRQILKLWTDAGAKANVDAIGLAFTSIWTLDTIFPLAYAMLFSTIYIWLREHRGVRPQSLLVALPYVAAGFDYVENLLLLWLLSHTGTLADGPVYVMSLAAVAKITLLSISGAMSIADCLPAIAAACCGRHATACCRW